MIVITDSNIVFSALKTPNGVIAKILKAKSNIQFFAPDYLIIEVNNHFDKIVVGNIMTKKELLIEKDLILSKIKILNVADIPKSKVIEALKIVENIDIDDLFFVAVHLLNNHKIWTGDKVLIDGLKAKGYNICVTTAELKQKIYKKPRQANLF